MLLSAQQMREADRACGIEGFTLMKRAGAAVFQDIKAYFPKSPVCVLCGSGNNGGDGFVVAHLLVRAGWDVQVGCSVPVESLTGEALQAAQLWGGDIFSLTQKDSPPCKGGVRGGSLDFITPQTLVVDALFGTGLARPLDDTIRCVLDKVRAIGCPVLAVDMPSGVNATTGGADPATLRATHTTTFCAKKLGHVLMPAAALCGRVVVHDIGVKPLAYAAHENAPSLWSWPVPDPNTHKYSRGHALIYGGRAMTGAARLAATASMKAGAGLCTVVAHKSAALIYRTTLPAHILFESCTDFATHYADPRRNAVLIGPGAGGGIQDDVLTLLATKKAAVLDADALTGFEGDTQRFYDALHDRVILTPHEGEFARIFPDIKGDKLTRAQTAADLSSGAVILLKGPDTIIAAKGRTPVINTCGTPCLATVGSGDVLAGIIVGLMAQGMGAFEAACAGAWAHGKAAQKFGAGLTAPDLINALGTCAGLCYNPPYAG